MRSKNEITQQWLKDNDACIEGRKWLSKQKDKSTKSIVNKLYNEKNYNWCLWLLYRVNNKVKITLWFIVLLSYVLLFVEFYLLLNLSNVSSFAVVAVVGVGAVGVVVGAVAGAVAVVVVGGAVGGAVGVGAGVVAVVVAVVGAVVGAVGVGVGAVGGAVAVGVGAVGGNIIIKKLCKIGIINMEEKNE